MIIFLSYTTRKYDYLHLYINKVQLLFTYHALALYDLNKIRIIHIVLNVVLRWTKIIDVCVGATWLGVVMAM